MVERYEYDVYGRPQIFDSTDTELTTSAIGNPYLFTGRRFDPESGNYYYRARIYSPDLGRFLQVDPLGYVDGLNLYAYVGNNPASWVDPYGQSTSIPWEGLVDLVLPEILSTGTLLKGILNGIGGAVVGVLGDASYAGESAQEMREFEERIRRAAAMTGEDGEDASSVTPTDDEEGVCDVDAGPGTDPQKKAPKFPKKGPGGDEPLKQIEDELEKMKDIAPSQALKENMKEAGTPFPPYPFATHHIVAANAPEALPARLLLAELGIDINAAENGIFLRTTELGDGPLHRGSHKNDYYQAVNKEILEATTQEEAIAILEDIAGRLMDGTFTW